MVERVSSKIAEEAAAIRREIAAMEQNALLVDARALPVIGLGIDLEALFATIPTVGSEAS